MASLGTFPFLQLLGNVSPVCMDGLRSFLNEQARIKACASAPISLLLSSALRRRPGSDSNSIHVGAGTLPPAACLCHHTVLAKTILRYVCPDRFWMTVGHGSTLRGDLSIAAPGSGCGPSASHSSGLEGWAFARCLARTAPGSRGHWLWWCTAFQLYPGPLSAGGDVHVHGLRASVPLKTSKRVCSSPPAWWPVAILVQSSAYFNPLVWGTFASYWVVNHLV
jgi:hypothetical protein